MIRTITGFLLACSTVGPVTFMLADRTPPFVRLSGKLEPDQLRAGDVFKVTWDLHVNAHRHCKPFGDRAVSQAIIDSAGARKDFEPVPSIADPLNRRAEIIRQKIMPMGLTYGRARYHAEAKFTCNWVQELVAKWVTELAVIVIDEPDIPFMVLPQD